MTHRDSKMLIETIHDYLNWIKSAEEQRGRPTGLSCRETLIDFLTFSIVKDITWEKMFTLDTLEAFCA